MCKAAIRARPNAVSRKSTISEGWIENEYTIVEVVSHEQTTVSTYGEAAWESEPIEFLTIRAFDPKHNYPDPGPGVVASITLYRVAEGIGDKDNSRLRINSDGLGAGEFPDADNAVGGLTTCQDVDVSPGQDALSTIIGNIEPAGKINRNTGRPEHTPISLAEIEARFGIGTARFQRGISECRLT